MEIKKDTEIKVHIPYTVTEGDWTYADTLILSEDEAVQLSEEDINGQISSKFDSWLEYVTTPAQQPTKEDLAVELTKLQKEKEEAEAKIALLTEQINTK